MSSQKLLKVYEKLTLLGKEVWDLKAEVKKATAAMAEVAQNLKKWNRAGKSQGGRKIFMKLIIQL